MSAIGAASPRILAERRTSSFIKQLIPVSTESAASQARELFSQTEPALSADCQFNLNVTSDAA
jgi:hypothetical protein